MNPHMLTKVRSKKIMSAASGKECTVRISSFIPGQTCSGANTVIGAHLPVSGKGVSTKVTDMAVAFCCFNCHAILDRVDVRAAEYIEKNYPAAAAMRLVQALVETHAQLIEAGIIVVPDGELI